VVSDREEGGAGPDSEAAGELKGPQPARRPPRQRLDRPDGGPRRGEVHPAVRADHVGPAAEQVVPGQQLGEVLDVLGPARQAQAAEVDAGLPARLADAANGLGARRRGETARAPVPVGQGQPPRLDLEALSFEPGHRARQHSPGPADGGGVRLAAGEQRQGPDFQAVPPR
jgi:hypothetical protein